MYLYMYALFNLSFFIFACKHKVCVRYMRCCDCMQPMNPANFEITDMSAWYTFGCANVLFVYYFLLLYCFLCFCAVLNTLYNVARLWFASSFVGIIFTEVVIRRRYFRIGVTLAAALIINIAAASGPSKLRA